MRATAARSRAHLYLAIVALLSSVAGARANSLEVLPVLVELPAPAMSAVLTVVNRGPRISTVQIRTFTWTQGAAGDSLTRTGALFASPPIAEIPPGSAQIFRILLREPAVGREAAYRLLLDELPSPEQSGQVRLALRISIPVFARPETRTRADLRWHAAPSATNGADIVAINQGTAAERVVGLSLALDGGRPVAATGFPNPWILPGAERHWHVTLPHPLDPQGGGQARLTGHLRASTLDVAAPLVRAQ